MIFTRTQADVDAAIALRESKVKVFEELSADDISVLERGTFTVNALNRIENKQEELKNLFNDMGYWDTPIKNKVWEKTQIFNVGDFQRIIGNTDILRKAFYVYKGTPETPSVSYYFEDINALEKILYDLDVMINDVKSNYRECDTFECGEE